MRIIASTGTLYTRNKNNKRNKKETPSFVDSSALFGNDADRVALVISLWRQAWTEAGEPRHDRLVGATTTEAATTIAEWLNTAAVSVDELRAGMRKLVDRIRADPKRKIWTLRVLANNPDEYITKIITAKRRVMVTWLYECDVCGACTRVLLPASEAPSPVEECVYSDVRYCQGKAYPQKENEYVE